MTPPARGWFYVLALGLAFTWGQCAARQEVVDYGELRFQEGRQLELLRAQPLAQRVARLDSLMSDSSCAAWATSQERRAQWMADRGLSAGETRALP